MHARSIVTRFFESALTDIHGSRRRVLVTVVWAAMTGSVVSLSRLARSITAEDGNAKASIKRVDRLIGHARIASEVAVTAQALLAALCRWLSPLVIAVDWSAVTPGGTFVELRAAVVWHGMGRGVTVHQRVYPAAKQGNRMAEQSLLRDLARWIPRGTKVIVICDAGFRSPWFRAVERLGWNWIGRLRGRNQIRHDGGVWQDAMDWGRSARVQPWRQSDCELTRRGRFGCDLVRVRRSRVGRKAYRCPGHGSMAKAGTEARASAREPWVLAHAKALRVLRADEIVALYALRMQIEEVFRDGKSLSFGMGVETGRSRSALRLQALLLIATLASYLLWHLGQLAEAEGLHRRFKVTTRDRRELSVIAVAILLCSQRDIPFSPSGVRALHRRWGITGEN
jgi:NAD(P)-dependent dehydrogenase (short-subunit alcohol dehydrogenase family)